VGQNLDSLRENMNRLVRVTNEPLGVFLQESKRAPVDWAIPGYKGHAAGVSFGEDHDNCRILVRNEVQILARGAEKVPGEPWEWNGNQKPTRVFPWLLVKWNGQVYLLICVHRIPNGPAPHIDANARGWVNEHWTLVRMVEEITRDHPGATAILGGDWNAQMSDMPEHPASLKSLRDRLDAQARILHIDGYMVINGLALHVEKLEGKFGSDAHRPVVGEVVPG
jgi:hypothetical protein